MFSNSIKQRLKILEMLTDKESINLPIPYIFFFTEPNGDTFKIRDTDLKYCKNIKDADKLEFKTEQECQEWIDSNIDLIELPSFYDSKKDKLKAINIKVVDNSHLDQFMYEYNRQSKGG